MDIWIIRNGEKTGPIHDFEVRKKIEAGELPADTPAWHEGLAAWKPLVEIDLFQREFDRDLDEPFKPVEIEQPTPDPTDPPPLPDSLYSLRRFWARWLDLSVYAGIWWISMWALGRDIGATLASMWVMMLFYVPWFALEAVLLHRFGTTPGKWLLGIRVINNDGTLLGLPEAIRRSSRVLFIGIGFGLNLISVVCHVMAYFTTKRLGKPLWDHAAGHRISTETLQPMRIVILVFIMFVSLVLKGLVVMPYVFEEVAKTSPEFRQLKQNLPPWPLPQR